MRAIGVTGGIGSGKTTVCRLLEDLGASVFYADDAAKMLMTRDPEVVAEIRQAFGNESYAKDGSLNRKHLAEIVFADPDKVSAINAIVHPRVAAAFETFRREAERNGAPLAVEEAALIFESGAHKSLNGVVVVESPVQTRIGRVVTRDNVRPEEVMARMINQLPPEELRSRANYLLINDGTLEELEARVAELYEKLTVGEG
jgi:dephospho-CoA kinase